MRRSRVNVGNQAYYFDMSKSNRRVDPYGDRDYMTQSRYIDDPNQYELRRTSSGKKVRFGENSYEPQPRSILSKNYLIYQKIP